MPSGEDPSILVSHSLITLSLPDVSSAASARPSWTWCSLLRWAIIVETAPPATSLQSHIRTVPSLVPDTNRLWFVLKKSTELTLYSNEVQKGLADPGIDLSFSSKPRIA